jgi:uroporphyrin-3 C-methyltransferase
MNDTSNNNPAEPGTTPTAPPITHKNPLAQLLSHLNLTQLTLAVLAVIFLWQWIDGKQQLNQIQQTLAQRLADIDGNNKANQTLTLQSQELVRELGGKLSLLESKYAESQSQRSAIESLYHDLSGSRDQMVLAEVEQLLLIAGQQLQLAANVKAALIAMQQADSRLQRMNRAALSGLRHAIANDMDKLRALPDVDVSTINARLDSLVTMVARLPLLQDVRPSGDVRPDGEKAAPATPAEEGMLKKLFHDIWQEVRDLVRIENIHENELPLLSPTQSFFLRENLKLRLLSARLALLAHDDASFKYDIKTAQEWIKMYFDVKSSEGAQMLGILQKLNASSIKIDMPDVSGSLEAVRHYRASHEKAAR